MTREIRDRIIERFMQNVYGREPDIESGNSQHNGVAGHWLEDQMGIQHDADNAPDLWGYECKNATGSKTTFGDWNASYFIWRDEQRFPNLADLTGENLRIRQRANKDEVFLRAFGEIRDNGRYSWSGSPSPSRTTNGFNGYGQAMSVNNNSISIIYSYSHDPRPRKAVLVPETFQIDNLLLLKWNEETITERVENKFGREGWFKCLVDEQDNYNAIMFGGPFHIDRFLQSVRNGNVIFDTGMKERRDDGTDRYRMQWRASNVFWEELSDERFDPPQV